MSPLGIIITGRLRTFFTERVFHSFLSWMSVLKEKYELYIVCVLNEDNINYGEFTFLRNLCKRYSIVKFDRDLFTLPSSDCIKVICEEMQLKGVYEDFKKEVKDDNAMEALLRSFLSQKKQLEMGVQAMKEFGVVIPTYIKTRFDLFYGVHLVPYSNPTSRLSPHSRQIEDIQLKLLNSAGFTGVDEYLEFCNSKGKGKDKTLDKIRIPEHLWQVNFGGAYYYNTDFYTEKKTLWLSNDFIFIGEPELFEKYCATNLFETPERLIELARSTGHTHLLSQESLAVLHMYSAEIVPILLLNAYVIYIQR